MTTSINFRIAGQHENHSGSATVLSTASQVKAAAENAFKADGDQREVKINKIGNFNGHQIFEAYTDSGSNDYYYFAVAE